jgi:phosphate transport system ATP-binding protein
MPALATTSTNHQDASNPGEIHVLEARDTVISYDGKPAVKNVSLTIRRNKITSLIGPSGCGKSTLLRAFNRMNDFIPSLTMSGQILFEGQDIYANGIDPVAVRHRVGMVFQRPNPFPKSIADNISWGPSLYGKTENRHELVERALRQAALWDEVKDKLDGSGLALSGGQQQRLCIARALAMDPDVILLDEPCSALDPVSTSRIEELLLELSQRYTIVIVTHNMQQASRVSDFTAFLYQGELIEVGATAKMFTRPRRKETEDYVTGKFG